MSDALSPLLDPMCDRVAALSAPSRDVDIEILWEVFPAERKRIFDGVRYISTSSDAAGQPAFFSRIADRHDCPRYTGSVDDALTLVPFGQAWRWLLDRRYAAASRTDGFRAEVTFSGRIEPLDCQIWASSPAIALAAAALKARSISKTWESADDPASH